MKLSMRIGHGYDVHKLVPGRKLILGGVEIPYAKGLMGHSDADVLTHAVIDALLGALAAGDIGRLFPDTDQSYKDIDSLELLSRCVELMENRGYALGNLDATIIAQKPKLAHFLDAMGENIAAVFDARVDQVNIKATTEEGMGFTGTGKGISAHCCCLIELFNAAM